jgi:hypothetical protein
LRQRLAVEVFHDEKIDAGLLPDVVDGADMRMIQRGNGPSLALEPLLQFGMAGDMSGERLDGDGSIEARVSGFVDLAHAARAERRLDLVRAERRA